MRYDVESIAKILDLVTIGEVEHISDEDQCVEIENRLGRAWMVLISYGDILSPDLIFVSKKPHRYDYDLHHFAAINGIQSDSDTVLVNKFKELLESWDIEYLCSLVLR
jgi:hypothetical protein